MISAMISAKISAKITELSAEALSGAIHRRQISCVEVMQAYLARIQRINPGFNAIVNLRDPAALLNEAAQCDRELGQGKGRAGSRGWMHGMPQAIKDTAQAAGLPTSFGSPLLADAVAAQDSLFVARMKAAGCIVIGKTNMPEFGLGSHTYNRLFGATPNAWDRSVSAGGSSGGAAVALAQRLLPVADGSDFMGSLRNPAGWNHVFGMRPSQGRVPGWPKPDLWVSQLATDGPMARHVRDLAALLSTQSGLDARVPLSLASPNTSLVPARQGAQALKGLRIGWLADLQGHLAVEDGILQVCESALRTMLQAGAEVLPLRPNFDPAQIWQAWLVWRRALVAQTLAPLLREPGARAQMKPEALWECDQAQGLPFSDFMAASTVRSQLHGHLLALFEQVDVLALPVAQTWPFDLALDWPKQIAGRAMDTYHRWMEVTIYATFAGLPAISMPAGFDPSGRWPMGIQLIGKPRGDAELLRIAAAYESLIGGMLKRQPPEVGLMRKRRAAPSFLIPPRGA